MIENTSFEDKEIVCRDCKQPFMLTGGEQQFFADKGLFTPSRCKQCRAANKARKDAEAGGAVGGYSSGGGYSAGGYSTGAPAPRPQVFEPPPQAPPRHAAKKRSGGGGGRGGGRGGDSDWGG